MRVKESTYSFSHGLGDTLLRLQHPARNYPLSCLRADAKLDPVAAQQPILGKTGFGAKTVSVQISCTIDLRAKPVFTPNDFRFRLLNLNCVKLNYANLYSIFGVAWPTSFPVSVPVRDAQSK